MNKYKVTQQYARDMEKPLAEFYEYDDANFFIERKLLSDSEKYLTLIYRLFDNQKLLKEFNKEKITGSIYTAQFAAGDRDLPDSVGQFKISKDNLPTHAFASFIDVKDAELFVEDKLTESNVSTTYYIFNKNVLVTQSNQLIKKQALAGESNQGKGQSASFRPTPLNTTPRPPGSPPSWIKGEEEDKDKK